MLEFEENQWKASNIISEAKKALKNQRNVKMLNICVIKIPQKKWVIHKRISEKMVAELYWNVVSDQLTTNSEQNKKKTMRSQIIIK